MELGLIGLGRMGGYMGKRWRRAGHTVVGYARHTETVQNNLNEGNISSGATSLEDLINKLARPRTIWLMVPAASVDATLETIVPLLAPDDVVIDGGNSYYHDDIRRAEALKPRGIHYLDCGTSGGVWGLDRGYCLMIGGDDEAVKRLDPIFAALVPGTGDIPVTPDRKGRDPRVERGHMH